MKHTSLRASVVLNPGEEGKELLLELFHLPHAVADLVKVLERHKNEMAVVFIHDLIVLSGLDGNPLQQLTKLLVLIRNYPKAKVALFKTVEDYNRAWILPLCIRELGKDKVLLPGQFEIREHIAPLRRWWWLMVPWKSAPRPLHVPGGVCR